MDLMYCLTADAHTLEDTEVAALLKFFIRECDRRFIDYQDIIEEAEQEMEMEMEEEEECGYDCIDQAGW